MANQSKPPERRSIIDHTTTCPYCGHRVLHKNLSGHIRRQHIDHSEREDLEKRIYDPEPDTCPYCKKVVDLRELEKHIQKFHPAEAARASAHVHEIADMEAAETQRRLSEVARKYGAEIGKDQEYDDSVPWEWKLAREKSSKYLSRQPRSTRREISSSLPTKNAVSPKAKTSSSKEDWTTCATCGVQVKSSNLEKHVRRIHEAKDDSTASSQTAPYATTSKHNGMKIVYCKICRRPVYEYKMVDHMKTHNKV